MAELRKVKLEVLELQAEVAAERKAKEAAEAKLERQGDLVSVLSPLIRFCSQQRWSSRIALLAVWPMRVPCVLDQGSLTSAGKMTARELAEVKLYDLIQVPANKSKTEGVNRRTFAEVKRWTDFEARVRNLLQSLDDTNRCFTAPEDAAASPFAAVPAVADESPVHGAVFLHLGNIVNRLAEHLKLRVRFQTSGRVLSFCDGTARLDKVCPPSTSSLGLCSSHTACLTLCLQACCLKSRPVASEVLLLESAGCP